jgi:hypothetical protein
MITVIFSIAQLRPENSFLQASLTVITVSDTPILSFSINLSRRTANRCSWKPYIVIMTSGMGSCRSRMTLAPASFDRSVLKTRTSGML